LAVFFGKGLTATFAGFLIDFVFEAEFGFIGALEGESILF
jgi:hypothetical protein